MAENTEVILAAISALDEKVGAVRTDIAGLKKTDEHLASEVFRIGEEQKRQGRELQELRAETLRTFESERHASAQTVQAITKHVDEAAKAFHAKAADIDEVKEETKKQSEELAKQSKQMGIDAKGFWALVQNAKLQDVVKLVTLMAAAYAAWKGIK
jgi:chromosome segregation ATPase